MITEVRCVSDIEDVYESSNLWQPRVAFQMFDKRPLPSPRSWLGGIMPSAESRKRVAVIIPEHRAWLWHQQVISTLQETFDVVTYVSTEAAAYPLFVRVWLTFESVLLKGRARVPRATIYGQSWTEGNDDFFFVLNLSENHI